MRSMVEGPTRLPRRTDRRSIIAMPLHPALRARFPSPRQARGGSESPTHFLSGNTLLSSFAATPTLRPARFGIDSRSELPITCAASDRVSP